MEKIFTDTAKSPETMRKLCLSTKFPHQEIRWNYGIFRSVTYSHFSTISIYQKWKWKWRRTSQQQQVNIRVASRVAERIKIQDLRKLGSFNGIPEMFGNDEKVLSGPHKRQILLVALQNCEFKNLQIAKTYVTNFVDLSTCGESNLHRNTINWKDITLSAKIAIWSNTLKQFVGSFPTNCLSVFDHFVGLALKGILCHWL